MLIKWFSRESRIDNVVGDEEMIVGVKFLSRWNGVGFCVYRLNLVLEEVGVVWLLL